MHGERIKNGQIKICEILECEWNTVTSSVFKIMIGLAKCVLRRIFETGEKEAEPFVTRIAC